MTRTPPPHKDDLLSTAARRPLEPPGGLLVWLIVVLELITFAAGVAVFVYQKGQHLEEFSAGAKALNQSIAFANTLILLTGGWSMATAIAWIRKGTITKALKWLTVTITTGIGFLLLKGFEFYEKIQHGATFGDDFFHTIYFALTGFHFLHVLAAVLILLYLRSALKRGRYTSDDFFDIESGGIFWHMCDLIWLVLYPVIYLI